MRILTIFALQWALNIAVCPPGYYTIESKKVSIDIKIYVNNYHSLYTGNETHAHQILEWIGVNDYTGFWQGDLTTDNYLYIVAWSNLQVEQGLNAYITQTIDGYETQIITTSSSSLKVTSTGRRGYQPTNGSQASLSELTTQIQLANFGNSMSSGWKTPTGPRRVSQVVNGLTFTTPFVWYSSNGVTDPTQPGYNHEEYLIFRFNAGLGYDQTCYQCKYGQYCYGGLQKPQKCPVYQSTMKFMASSISECKSFQTAWYQNLNKESITDLYEVSFTLQKAPGYVHFDVKCDIITDVYREECQYNNFLAEITFTDCSAKYSTSGTVINRTPLSPWYLQIQNSDCKIGKFKTSHKILNIYYEYQTTGISQSFVQASLHQEQHKLFFINGNYNLAYVVLKFESPTSTESVNINYSPGKYSSGGLAQGDYFFFEDPYRYTFIYLTNQKDTLIVNDTYNKNNKTAPIPTFFLLNGDDEVICSTHCNIYGGDGSDTFRLTADVNMIIYDFDVTKDIINLNGTHPNIKTFSYLTYTISDSTTLKITFSSTSSLTLHPFSGSIYQIKFNFGITCSSYCYECINEDQCKVCQGCGYCNSTQCLWCNSNNYLQEGKCVAQCDADKNYLINPLNITQCSYCSTENCEGCGDKNYCIQCEADYIPVSGVCQKCNTTYYSSPGDLTCKKCGDGCDKCNKTHCLVCSPGYLYAPKLSTSMCYQDLSSGISTYSVSKQISANSLQSSMISNGVFMNKDGTLSEISYSIGDISSERILDPIQYSKYLDMDDLSMFYDLDGTLTQKRALQTSDPTVTLLKVPLIRQYDDKWKKVQYAHGPNILKNKACLITCHTMALRYLGIKFGTEEATPVHVNNWLIANSGYTKGGSVIHSVLDKLTPYKMVAWKETSIDKIKDAFNKNQFVFLNVKRNPESTMHYVFAIGINPSGKSFYVNDPGYKDKFEYSIDNIINANIYQMKSTITSLPKKTVNKNVFSDAFSPSDLNYDSCYKYSKLSKNSQHYKDAYSIMTSTSIDLKQFSQVKAFTSVVESSYPKIPSKTKICNQKNEAWAWLHEHFGITTGYDTQTFDEEGSQICSLAMVLETLGKKDEDKMSYFPDSIDGILSENDAYKTKKRTKKILDVIKYLSTKNQIDFSKIQSEKLFGLTEEIIEVSNSNMVPISSTVQDQITKQMQTGQYLFILEVIDSDKLDTYSVFSLNKVTNGQILVNDPFYGKQGWIYFSRVTGYTRFKASKLYNAPKLKEIHEFISGIPHRHIVLTYRQDSLKAGQFKDKKYYLTQWKWSNKHYFNNQNFQVIDPSTLQELTVTPLVYIDKNLYTLNKIEVYINRDYLLDTSQLVSKQACSSKEIMAFVRMNQQQYTNSDGKSLTCFDNSVSSQCPTVNNKLTCSVQQCQGFFQTQLSTIESTLKKQTGFPTTDSRYCAMAKFSYLSGGTSDITSDSSLVKYIQEKKFYRAAYSIYSKKSTCLMKPRQAEEIFQGLYFNKSPKITNSPTKIDKMLVLQKLIELVGSETQFQNNAQLQVSKSIILVLGVTEDPKAKQKTEEFGRWIESKGYLRSDLTLDQAIAGDIAIFKGTKEYPFGHVAVKSQTTGVWYSDHKQSKECIYTYSSYTVYN